MKVFIFVIIVVATNADYHDEVGIPLAARIKAYEDKIFANPEMESRIVGGEIAPDNAYPYLAGLLITVMDSNTGESTCGSSLVTITRLVTAAHCLKRAESVKIRMGSQYIYHGGTEMISKDFSMHPNYDLTSWHNDIGVVRLSEQVQLSETIQLVSLPSTKDDVEVEGEIAFAAGWGLTSDDKRDKPDSIDLRLSHVGLKIISDQVCSNLFPEHYNPGNDICTDGTGGVGICDGDYGEPLVVTRNDRKILVGVTALDWTPCQASFPSVFTRVESYKDFIMNF